MTILSSFMVKVPLKKTHSKNNTPFIYYIIVYFTAVFFFFSL